MLFTLQRYEFFSKSQPSVAACAAVCDVVYPTKVRIFQQITTSALFRGCVIRMLFTLQRYEFFSKSQHLCLRGFSLFGCCLPYKGTNFSANHNCKQGTRHTEPDVVYPTKVRIFQQITTTSLLDTLPPVMLFTLQRYEFFSKSQRQLATL